MKGYQFVENFILRLKTAAKVIAIAGMVLSLIGFSVAMNRLVKMKVKANINTNDIKTSDFEGVAVSEKCLLDKQESTHDDCESGAGEVLLPASGGQKDDLIIEDDGNTRSKRESESKSNKEMVGGKRCYDCMNEKKYQDQLC